MEKEKPTDSQPRVQAERFAVFSFNPILVKMKRRSNQFNAVNMSLSRYYQYCSNQGSKDLLSSFSSRHFFSVFYILHHKFRKVLQPSFLVWLSLFCFFLLCSDSLRKFSQWPIESPQLAHVPPVVLLS